MITNNDKYKNLSLVYTLLSIFLIYFNFFYSTIITTFVIWKTIHYQPTRN
jgi:hypothetical protein